MRIVKRCNGCHKTLSINSFSPRSSRCKLCIKFKVLPTKARLMPPHLERDSTHKLVKDALRIGLISKSPCSCGNLVVHGHHEDYSKPLDVTWLCNSCHRSVHNKKNFNLKLYKSFIHAWCRKYEFI